MRSPTRHAALAAMLVLFACLALPACSRKPPSAAEHVARSSLRYLPKESAGVAVLEAARLTDRTALTRLLGEVMGESSREPGYAAMRGLLGADFLQKVDRVAVALVPEGAPAAASPPAGAAPATPSWVALFEGRFDEKTLKSIGPEGTLVTLLEVSGGPEVSLLALPGKALGIGPRATLEKVHQVMAHPDTGLGRSGLMATLGKVAGDAQAWGAIDYAPLTDLARGALSGGLRESMASPLPILPARAGTLRAVAFEARIGTGMDFTLVGVASDDEGAKRLAEAARGLVALARMGAGQETDKSLFDFLDGLRVSEEKSDLRLTGSLSRPMMEALMARAGSALEARSGSGATPNAAPAPSGNAPAARP